MPRSWRRGRQPLLHLLHLPHLPHLLFRRLIFCRRTACEFLIRPARSRCAHASRAASLPGTAAAPAKTPRPSVLDVQTTPNSGGATLLFFFFLSVNGAAAGWRRPRNARRVRIEGPPQPGCWDASASHSYVASGYLLTHMHVSFATHTTIGWELMSIESRAMFQSFARCCSTDIRDPSPKSRNFDFIAIDNDCVCSRHCIGGTW